jgi:catechol 2,3-dioxygenase-like lactoylglutathione lyase family enzyme
MIDYSYDHLHLASADAFGTAQWFADNFGAVVTSPWTEPNGVQHVMVNLNGVDIFVKSRAEKPTVESNSRRAYGLEHFSILSSDIDAAVAALKANGVTFVADISATPLPGVRHAFLSGPDDILIELMERKSA